ncbi:MAG: peptidoglycan-binding domain-containing protein [Bryobacteraceae bacterium]
MFQAILTALALSAIACSSLAATPAKAHKHRHTATTASTTAARKHTAVATKTASAKTTKAASRHKGKVSRPPVRSYQQVPTPDRYREIQQALASKGYYKGDPNGEWGADSSDALKRFQADQSLMPDGKINSLSLIALGLGPKRLSAKSDSAPQPAAPAPPPPNAPQ